jgi:predicted metal-dependent hydrolase
MTAIAILGFTPILNLMFRRQSQPAEPENGLITLTRGQITFTVTRSAKRKRTVSFALDSPSNLRVMAPLRASFRSIHTMLQSRANWIEGRIAAMQRDIREPRDFTDGAMIDYLGHRYRLHITHDSDLPQGCHLRPRRLRVNLPDDMPQGDVHEAARLEILLWLKKRAKAKMQKRLDLWGRRLNVHYQKMIVTAPERLWGSCSADNVIRLNWRLIMAPLPLLDYVAAHELCHVVHKNHSPRFWRLLTTVMPDWQARRKTLRRIGGGLVL